MERVMVESAEGFRHVIQAGPHELVSDLSSESGGEDSGAYPYQLLLAALGSCTSMTMRMYAQRKGLPLEGVRVELEHEKGADGRTDHITKRIYLSGKLSPAEVRRLAYISTRCPINQTLLRGVSITDSVELEPAREAELQRLDVGETGTEAMSAPALTS